MFDRMENLKGSHFVAGIGPLAVPLNVQNSNTNLVTILG